MAESNAREPEIVVQVALAQLGLPAEIISGAVRHGYTQAAACTPNDPKNTRGFLAYAEGTGRLRDLLAPNGWQARERNGYESTES
ncbi:MAG TPA: hypothetical protein VG329_00230, partial [Candidatus Dormibacteraeota bacterium]|nr:hypothetical protein [Candidatus Dormibacteraeota bacterium]